MYLSCFERGLKIPSGHGVRAERADERGISAELNFTRWVKFNVPARNNSNKYYFNC
jgi:hypothetical protein